MPGNGPREAHGIDLRVGGLARVLERFWRHAIGPFLSRSDLCFERRALHLRAKTGCRDETRGIRWPCCRPAPKSSTSRRITRRMGWIRCQGAKHVMENRVAPKRNALRENRRSRQNVRNPPAVFLKLCAKTRSRRNVIRRPCFGSLRENRKPRHKLSNPPFVFQKFRAKAGSRHKT